MRHIRTLWIASLLVITSALTACKTESNYFVDENASGGDGTDNGAPTTATGFRVRLKAKTGVESFLHKFGDVNAPCEIAKADANNPGEMYCMLNMMEYDVWFHGFEYELNVPEGFCHYIEERPYQYYIAPPGKPPESVEMVVNNGVVTSCQVGGVPVPIQGLACNTGEGLLYANGSFNCAYNYSLADARLPNCCEGRMNTTITTYTPNDQGVLVGVIQISEVVGGGLMENCYDTPHFYITTWPKYSTTGLPATSYLELANQTYTRTQKIPSEYDVRAERGVTKSVTFLAGFHDWAAYAADPLTWPSTRTIPRSFAPVNDRGIAGDFSSGSAVDAAGDGSYQFSCLGPAGELRHRIRLYLNEWNTVEDFQAFRQDGDPTAVDPNRTGLAGVNCAAVNTGLKCNTYWGFDDLITRHGAGDPGAYVFPASYWTDTPD